MFFRDMITALTEDSKMMLKVQLVTNMMKLNDAFRTRKLNGKLKEVMFCSFG
jgi:hypothetical protein